MTLMNPDLTPLKTYIRSQRANNKTDEAITASLTAAGWQVDMVMQAFGEMQHEHETQVTQPAIATEKPSMNQDESARAVVEPQEQLATVESVDSPQQSAIQTDESDKYRKQVKIIAKITTALGVLAMIAGLYPGFDGLLFFSGVVQVAIGLGLLAFKKIAYTLFNVFVILMIVVTLAGLILSFLSPLGLLLFILPFEMLFTAPDISVIINIITVFILGPAQFIFYIYSGLYFHKKEVRSLFARK